MLGWRNNDISRIHNAWKDVFILLFSFSFCGDVQQSLWCFEENAKLPVGKACFFDPVYIVSDPRDCFEMVGEVVVLDLL